jgi:HD-GYP domain-containing protein (c-di-GMP phosphodiesterase class II)
MGIPDNILLKPGPLSDDEWVIMKKHPIYAYNLLSKIDFLKQAVDIPFSHHERWDGSGYPQGLAGENIPLAARIFAVVDIWDALGSDRPYRPSWKRKDIMKYIQDISGKHLDPGIVNVFLQLMETDEDHIGT